MATPNNSPRDLARLVFASLREERNPPTIEVLEELFQVLFLTSLEKEEGVSPRCAVAFASLSRPDPDPPERIRSHRWTFSPFGNPIALTVASLAKLAIACDPDLSSLAVYPNRRGQLEICGMFDQQGGFKALMRHEPTPGGFAPPGLFQAEIRGPGHIVVTQGGTILGELKGGWLVSISQDVFGSGPVRTTLMDSTKRLCMAVRSVAAGEGHQIAENNEADTYIIHWWFKTLRRLLLRARTHGQGGAFLIIPSRSLKHLKIRHRLRYDRLGRLLALALGHWFVKENVYDLLTNEYFDIHSEDMPMDLYLAESVADGEREDAEEALTGALGFVASLSRLDGLVVMNRDLCVLGFGAEITAPDIGNDLVTVPSGNSTRGKRTGLERFGTRHRSMFRYCAAHPGSIGFVLSKDGPVRAMLRHVNRVLLWENIQLTGD